MKHGDLDGNDTILVLKPRQEFDDGTVSCWPRVRSRGGKTLVSGFDELTLARLRPSNSPVLRAGVHFYFYVLAMCALLLHCFQELVPSPS